MGVLVLEDPVTDIEPAKLPDSNLLSDLKKDGTLEGGYWDSTSCRIMRTLKVSIKPEQDLKAVIR